MTTNAIVSRLNELPEEYKILAMNYIEDLIKKNKLNKINISEASKRRREFGSMKGKIWMSKDFDDYLDLVPQKQPAKEVKENKKLTAIELLQMTASEREKNLKEQAEKLLNFYSSNPEILLHDLCDDFMEYE